MKTTLPKRSIVIKERLNIIVQEILAVAKDKIAMIILFGSYARGDWVIDEYIEGRITYTYCSDMDLMLVMKKEKYAGRQGEKIITNIEKRLERKLPRNPYSFRDPWATFIVEPIDKVNKTLEEGRYFFCDIRKEGILLYDNGEFQLAEAMDISELPWTKRKEIAKEEYEQWFNYGSEFFIGINVYLERGNYPLSAFLLHQATESFYNAILLVFRGDKRKLHDIEKLGNMAKSHHKDLLTIFPRNTPKQDECFKLLRCAYIEARYNKNYKISKEQLVYLIERVKKLQKVTQQICLEWINKEII